jgi:hypothetical protein
MLIRSLLRSTAVHAPENDQGAAYEDHDENLESDVGGADEDLDDADDQESADDGSADRGEDDDDGATDGSQDRQAEADGVRRPNRAQARVEAALREAKEAKAEVQRLREEAQNGRSQGDVNAARAQRESRLAAMDPYERQQFLSEERLQAQDQRLARIEFNSMDAADRTDFAAKCARNPALATVAEQVEVELKRIRANGNNTDRETIAAYVLGKRALERGASAATRQGKKGAARIESQRARPSGGRSDTRAEPSARGDTRAARNARLENVEL